MTVLELLIVMALVLSAFVVLVAGHGMTAHATSLATTAALLDDALKEGRSQAIAQGATVEVRIYDSPSPPGAAPVYDAMQLHWLRADKTTPPASEPVLLPDWVAIDATATHSTLIAAGQGATPDASDARLDSQTRVFHFLPDGSTDLNPATNWFMTVRPANQADPAHFPANWACLRVDATTGRVQIYRP